MKTDKQLSQAIMQQIKEQTPRHMRAKKRTRLLITTLCALAFLAPAFLLFFQKFQPTTPDPKPTQNYTQSSEETEEK